MVVDGTELNLPLPESHPSRVRSNICGSRRGSSHPPGVASSPVGRDALRERLQIGRSAGRGFDSLSASLKDSFRTSPLDAVPPERGD